MKNNATVGSQIAVELAQLLSSRRAVSRRRNREPQKGQTVVIGASILDSTAKMTSPFIKVSEYTHTRTSECCKSVC